jgi:hypothetical protein
VKRVKSKQKMTFRWVLLIVLLVPLIVAGGFIVLRLEGHAPQVAHDLAEPFVGAPREIVLDITERGRGLQTIRVSVVQGGRETLLEELDFDGSMLWAGSGILTHRLPLNTGCTCIVAGRG